MGDYIHLFQTVDEYNEARANDYLEPWGSYILENERVNYNKDEREKLRGTPLTFEITGDGVLYWKWAKTGTYNNYERTIQYSKNGGSWTSITSASGSNAPTISVVSGDVLQFKGDNAYYGYTESDPRRYDSVSFSGSTCQFSIKGNIMSLVSSSNFTSLTGLSGDCNFYQFFQGCTGLTDASKLILPCTKLTSYCYDGMFKNCTNLIIGPELPATELGYRCYSTMFSNCTNLIQAPALPATVLKYGCYQYMFENCTSLAQAPELPASAVGSSSYQYMFAGCTSLTAAPALPATALNYNCYSGMFSGCTNITKAPILPATNLSSYCYQNMFEGCTSLIEGPELPAIVLADRCYYSMFKGCTSLTAAPELPAATVKFASYFSMFEDCTKLEYIKCLATDISATQATNAWVRKVSSTGTFVKNPAMTSWTTDTSGIPAGWTVVDAS